MRKPVQVQEDEKDKDEDSQKDGLMWDTTRTAMALTPVTQPLTARLHPSDASTMICFDLPPPYVDGR